MMDLRACDATLPHDLLEIGGAGALVCDAEPPAWVAAALAAAPVVVVRRVERRGALLPVGVRGPGRNARFAAWVPPERVASRTRPEDLARRGGWRDPGRRELLQRECLDAIDALLLARGLAWGPVGSTGFELATGVPCVTDASDVDLVLRPPGRLSLSTARALLSAFEGMPRRIDAQIETPAGALALAEYASRATRVVLRTARGPQIVPHPWPHG